MSFAWNINDPASQGAIEEKTALTALKATAQEQMAYFRFEKPKDKRSLPRTWRTRKEPFEQVGDEIKFKLELEPHSTAREVIEWLSGHYPNQYNLNQVRTRQRRISSWRLRDKSYQAKLTELMQS